MNKENLFYQPSPKITVATNTFINTPVVLKYHDTNLIEVVNDVGLGYTTEIPIYHSDGTYLAKVRGTRIYATEAGNKAGLAIEKHADITACTLHGKTAFEIRHQPGDLFKLSAELYTPDARFLKTTDHTTLGLFDINGDKLQIGGMMMSGCTFEGCRIGVWLQEDGGVSIGIS